MSDLAPALPEASPPPAIPVSVSSNGLRWLELFLVLSLSIGTSIRTALYYLHHVPNTPILVSTSAKLFHIFQHLVGLLLLAYVLHRRGKTFQDIGLRWSYRNLWMGLLGGIIFLAVQFYSSFFLALLYRVFLGPVVKTPSAKLFFGNTTWLTWLLVLFNGFYEELIVRAYLMTEVLELTSSGVLAVLLSTVIQFSYHLYYGWFGALRLTVPFFLLSLYYLRTRNATTISVAHVFYDALISARYL